MKSTLFAILTALAAGAESHAQTLQLVSGHGQVMQEQSVALKPFALRAVDAAGRPIPNVPITWTVTPTSAGSLINASAQTNAQGEASTGFFASSNQPGASFTTGTITASSPNGIVVFALVVSLSRGPGGNLVPLPFVQPTSPPQGSTIEGAAGTILPGAVSVKVVAQGGSNLGQPIPNVGLRVEPIQPSDGPTAMCNAPAGIVITDQNGVATCDLVLSGVPGSVGMQAVIGEYWPNLRFELKITPGSNCTFSVTPLTQTFAASGGSGTISVGSAQSCSWNAFTSTSWISITGSSSGQGNGGLTFSVAANPGAQRSGTLTIANQTVTISQAAAGTTGGASLAFSVTPLLPSGTTGLSYSIGLTATGGTPPYRWTAGGALPPGLALNPSTGVISGTPSTAGTYTIPVTLADALNASISQTFTLVISQAIAGSPTLLITTSSFAAGSVGVPYQQAVTTSGGCSNPFSGGPVISLASGALPPGLMLQTLTSGGFGVAGTPTAAGSYPFALRASACTDATAREFTITIAGTPTGTAMTAAPSELLFTTVAGGVTRPPDQTISISTGTGVTSFGASASTTSGGNWLVVSPSTGQTPASLIAGVINHAALPAGVYRGSVTIVSQSGNSPVVIPVTLTVSAAPAINVSTNALRFEHTLGSLSISEQTIGVTSSSGDSVAFATSVSSGAQWLTLAPASGQTPANVRIIANSAVLLPGTYDAFVTFAPVANPAAPRTLHVVLAVTAPTVQPNLPIITSVTNAASFAPGGVSPGEFVTIFGTNVGPASAATFRLTPAGTLDSTLGNTRVLFDGIPAPLIYASAGQISAIVPYALAGRVSTRIVVEQGGNRSSATEVAVVDSAPGIFTLGGTSQGAIINQDGTLNGLQGAAPAGSIVSIYATGEGVTWPIVAEGTLASADQLARPALPVTVQIGGEQAEVLYAGTAPGLLVGVLQVNARISESAPRGNDVPIVLTVGGNSSRPAAMAIR